MKLHVYTKITTFLLKEKRRGLIK